MQESRRPASSERKAGEGGSNEEKRQTRQSPILLRRRPLQSTQKRTTTHVIMIPINPFHQQSSQPLDPEPSRLPRSFARVNVRLGRGERKRLKRDDGGGGEGSEGVTGGSEGGEDCTQGSGDDATVSRRRRIGEREEWERGMG